MTSAVRSLTYGRQRELSADLQSFLGTEVGASSRLARALTPIVRASARRVLRRSALRQRCLRTEIDDVTQDVLEQLFAQDGRLLRRWDPSRGRDLAGFIALIAQRAAISSLRGRARHRLSEDPFDGAHGDPRLAGGVATPEEVLGSIQAIQRICALAAASSSRRAFEVFRMLCLESLEVGEVSRLLGISTESVYAHHHRLRRRLATALNVSCD